MPQEHQELNGNNPNNPFNSFDIPLEIFQQIMSFLTHKDLLHLSQTSKEWKHLVENFKSNFQKKSFDFQRWQKNHYLKKLNHDYYYFSYGKYKKELPLNIFLMFFFLAASIISLLNAMKGITDLMSLNKKESPATTSLLLLLLFPFYFFSFTITIKSIYKIQRAIDTIKNKNIQRRIEKDEFIQLNSLLTKHHHFLCALPALDELNRSDPINHPGHIGSTHIGGILKIFKTNIEKNEMLANQLAAYLNSLSRESSKLFLTQTDLDHLKETDTQLPAYTKHISSLWAKSKANLIHEPLIKEEIEILVTP